MGRFRIDHAELDTEQLERRVREAIESKRGRRFSQRELDRLRSTRLEPTLRREDLPRGFLQELSRVRALLPEAPPSPGPEPSAAVRIDRGRDGAPVAIGAALWESHSPGLKGRVIRLLRRLARPLVQSVVNLEHTFEQMRIEGERAEDRQVERLERSYDQLKEGLDRRVDRVADWAGGHTSELTGTLERRYERQLQLLHNLVFELSHARLKVAELEDRLYETRQQMAQSEERQRTLEEMLLADRRES